MIWNQEICKHEGCMVLAGSDHVVLGGEKVLHICYEHSLKFLSLNQQFNDINDCLRRQNLPNANSAWSSESIACMEDPTISLYLLKHYLILVQVLLSYLKSRWDGRQFYLRIITNVSSNIEIIRRGFERIQSEPLRKRLRYF